MITEYNDFSVKDFNALLTWSNARRGEFHARADQMGYRGPGPIAGWGVRWNIDLAMYSHLVAARDVSVPLYVAQVYSGK